VQEQVGERRGCHPHGGSSHGARDQDRPESDRDDPSHLLQAADGARPRYPAGETGIAAELERVRQDGDERDQLEERASIRGLKPATDQHGQREAEQRA